MLNKLKNFVLNHPLYTIGLIGLIAYINIFNTDYIGDDLFRIRDIFNIYTEDFFSTLLKTMPDRPLLIFTLWFNVQTTQDAVWGMKTTSLLIHILSAFSLYYLLEEILKTFTQSSDNQYLKGWALIVSLAWVAHPMNNQAVMSIIQRGISLAALFYFLSFYHWIIFLKTTKYKNYFYSLLCLLLALASKPIVIMAPLTFALIYFSTQKIKMKKDIFLFLPLFFLVVLPAIPQIFFNQNSQLTPLNSVDYFWVQTEYIFRYLGLYFLPFKLSFFTPYSYAYPPTFTQWRLLFAFIHLTVLLTAFWQWSKKRSIVSFFILMTYLSWLPESSFFSINQLYFDHRNYIPLAFFLSALFYILLTKIKRSQWSLVLTITSITLWTCLNIQFTSDNSSTHKFFVHNVKSWPMIYGQYVRNPFMQANYKEAEEILDAATLDESQKNEINNFKDFLGIRNKSLVEKTFLFEQKINELAKNSFSQNYYLFLNELIKKEFEDSSSLKIRYRLLRHLHLITAPYYGQASTHMTVKMSIADDLIQYLKSVQISPTDFQEIKNLSKQNESLPALKTILYLNIVFKIPFDRQKLEEVIKSDEKLKADFNEAAHWLTQFIK